MDQINSNVSSLNCSPNFYVDNSTCLPVCQKWTQYTDVQSALVIGSATVSAVLSLLAGAAVIVGSIIQRKTM